MKSTLLRTTAVALAAALVTAPSVATAGKGGVPAAQAQANGQGANNAHQNGRATDPNPGRGNDSSFAAPEQDYEEVGAELADVEGEEDVEEY